MRDDVSVTRIFKKKLHNLLDRASHYIQSETEHCQRDSRDEFLIEMIVEMMETILDDGDDS